MRLRTLLIEKYGNFDRAELAFDPAPGRLNLLLAPNGAGKSVLRRAFHDLLFGIPLQSDMRFRFDYPGMHLRADAVSAEGAEYAVAWQRKGGRSFPTAGADPAAARWFEELMKAVTPRQVEMLFALDTARLRSGGEELASGDGTVGSALLSGTGELSSARALRRSLDERRNAIWEKSKSSRPLAKALGQVSAAGKDKQRFLQTPRALGLAQAARDEMAERRERAAKAADDAQVTLGRLHRVELTRGPLATLAEAEVWLAANPDAPALPAGLDDRLAQARQAVSLAAARLTDARTALAEATASAAAAERDAAADAAETELAALPGALGDATTKRRDSTARVAERAAALREVAAALHELGSDAAPEDAGRVIPTTAAVAAAREQISEYTRASTTLSLAREVLDKAKTALARLASEAAQAPAATPDGLEALLHEIRRDRDPVAHAAEAADRTRQAIAAEQACAARLPGWAGRPEELIALQPATEQAYERLAQAVAEAQAALAKAIPERELLRSQRTKWQSALAALRERKVPDQAALDAARAVRDAGWRLIQARLSGTPDDAAEHAYGAGETLPVLFDRHLHAADRIADARIDAIADVKEAARLQAEIEGSEPAWDAAQGAVFNADSRQTAANEAWRNALAPLRLPADASLREVTALLKARQDAIEARRLTELARGAQDALADQHRVWAGRLAGLLGQDGALAALLPAADAVVQAAASAQKATVARETRRATAETAATTAATQLAAAESTMARWQTGWAATLQALGRPPGETPAVTERVLARFADLEKHHRIAAGLRSRIDDMAADLTSFAQTVAALTDRLGMPPQADPFAAAQAMVARRDQARSLASAAAQAQLALTAATQRVQDAATQDREAAAALAAVLAACGAADEPGAEQRIAAARERTRQETARDSATARLRELAGGVPFPTLAAEAAALPPDRFEAERLATEAALAQATQDAQAAAIDLAELDRQFAANAAATSASEAAEAEANAAAEAGRLLDEYLLLRVAGGMLARALDRVEEAAGPTGLQRIAAAFAAITDGAWTIRAGENARGETLLLAQETGVNEPPKQIDQLSEGTRDQLYLALRLVAIESHVATQPPLPFVADDILQTFDDARARAAMQALIGLSQHVQVIVLTHHPHLLEVAKDLPVHIQRL